MNDLLELVKELSKSLFAISGFGLAIIQYIKDTVKIEDKAASILSLVVGFLLSAVVDVVYLISLGWTVDLSQGLALGVFTVLGTIGASGGYKFLKSLVEIKFEDDEEPPETS